MMMIRANNRVPRAAAAVAGVLLLASAAAAQEGSGGTPVADPRWQGWIGCWEPAGTAVSPALRGTARPFALCVLPAEGESAVEVVTIVDGRAERRERIDASGEPWRTTVDGCTGWERAEWSADGRRVFLTADRTCEGGMKLRSTGVIAMSTQGQWLDVRGISASGGEPVVRVGRYREADDAAGLPRDVAAALRGRGLFAAAARSATVSRLGTAEVAEAARRLDPTVVQAWLAESGQQFAVDAKQLVELADAKVPERVIDLMVALSYPRTFAVNRATRQPEQLPRPARSDSGQRTIVSNWDRWDMPGSYGYYGCGYRGYSCGYGYGVYPYGYGYGLYPGAGYGYGWYGNDPVIIVVRPGNGGTVGGGGSRDGGGRVVKGRGYTRGDSDNSGGGSASPRGSVNRDGGYSSGASTRSSGSSGGSSGGSSSSSSSGGSSSSSGGSSSSGSGRTAKPRSP